MRSDGQAVSTGRAPIGKSSADPLRPADSLLQATGTHSSRESSIPKLFAARDASRVTPTNTQRHHGPLKSRLRTDSLDPLGQSSRLRLPELRLSGSFGLKETDKASPTAQGLTARPMDSSKRALNLGPQGLRQRKKLLLDPDCLNPDSSMPPKQPEAVQPASLHTSRSRASKLAECYAKIHFFSIKEKDSLLLTQAKLQKEKRDRGAGASPRTDFIKNRLCFVGQFLKQYRDFFDSHHIAASVCVQLLVTHAAGDFVCLEKSFSTAKLVEHFVIIHHLHFDSHPETETDLRKSRLIERLQGFLEKAARGALEIALADRQQFERFTRLTNERRAFLSADCFARVRGFEAFLLAYLFLEYAIQVTPEDIRRIFLRIDLRELERDLPRLTLDVREDRSESSQLPSRDTNQPPSKKADVFTKRVLQHLKKIEKNASKQRLTFDADGKMTYYSPHLKRVEVCLDNKDSLFSMSADLFNQIVDLKPSQLNPELIEENPLIGEKKQIYFELLGLRQHFRDAIRELGPDLQYDLDLIEKGFVEPGPPTEQSGEGLRQDSSDAGQSVEAVDPSSER